MVLICAALPFTAAAGAMEFVVTETDGSTIVLREAAFYQGPLTSAEKKGVIVRGLPPANVIRYCVRQPTRANTGRTFFVPWEKITELTLASSASAGDSNGWDAVAKMQDGSEISFSISVNGYSRVLLGRSKDGVTRRMPDYEKSIPIEEADFILRLGPPSVPGCNYSNACYPGVAKISIVR